MKARLYGEGTGSSYTGKQRALFGELVQVPVCILQLVGKRYPLKTCSHTLKKGEKKKKKPISFRQNLPGSIRPFPEPIQLFVQVYPAGSPRKGGVSTREEALAKELNLERSHFVFDRQ